MFTLGKLSIPRRAAMRWDRGNALVWAGLAHVLPVCSRPTFCLGDSHIIVWNYVDCYYPSVLPRFITLAVRGATALGLANPNSKTNAIQEFDGVLRNLPSGSRLIFNLGEVDCGFLVWLISRRDGVGVDDVFERSMSSYLQFVDQCVDRGFDVMLCAAPQATIGDGDPVGDVAILRAGITATQAMRTELILNWNARLKYHCAVKRLKFIDTDAILISKHNDLICDIFKNADPGDHHLDQHSYAMAILLALRSSGISGLGVSDVAR